MKPLDLLSRKCCREYLFCSKLFYYHILWELIYSILFGTDTLKINKKRNVRAGPQERRSLFSHTTYVLYIRQAGDGGMDTNGSAWTIIKH
jgi:hypothetical protein